MSIAKMNDVARKSLGVGCRLMQTTGICSLSLEDQSLIREKVEKFDDFNEGNDPYGEHDFGAFEHNGDKIFWKIDYYDSESTLFQDTNQTGRILTIMLADEY